MLFQEAAATLQLGGMGGRMAQGAYPVEAMQQLFYALDDDRSGTLDLHEFMAGISVLVGGTVNDRLRLCFRMLDTTGTGNLDLDSQFGGRDQLTGWLRTAFELTFPSAPLAVSCPCPPTRPARALRRLNHRAS